MEKLILIGGPSQLQLYQQLSHHDFRQLVRHECCNSECIRRELGGTGTGCLIQLPYCAYDSTSIASLDCVKRYSPSILYIAGSCYS